MDEQPRARGLRQVRRWSNGTAAALIAATALTTGYFARAAAAPAAGSAALAAGQQGAGQAGTGQPVTGQPVTGTGKGQPCVSVPVATSGGSGVTRQTVIRSCGTGSGTGSGAPVVIVTGRSGEGGDN
jgi:hypothetical protein